MKDTNDTNDTNVANVANHILELEARLEAALIVIQHLQYEATHDHLTGLLNRKGLYNYVENELDSGTWYIVHVIDVNGLKAVNDTAGHKAGDQFIKDIVAEIETIVDGWFKKDPEYAFARIGGDEFVIVTPGNERLVSDTNYSVGSRTYKHGFDDFDAVVSQADSAMYARKKLSYLNRDHRDGHTHIRSQPRPH